MTRTGCAALRNVSGTDPATHHRRRHAQAVRRPAGCPTHGHASSLVGVVCIGLSRPARTEPRSKIRSIQVSPQAVHAGCSDRDGSRAARATRALDRFFPCRFSFCATPRCSSGFSRVITPIIWPTGPTPSSGPGRGLSTERCESNSSDRVEPPERSVQQPPSLRSAASRSAVAIRSSNRRTVSRVPAFRARPSTNPSTSVARS